MPEITAALVKDLREKTGAGMMDCKRALTETGGDMEAAVDWLRTKGLAAAAKKSGRVAAEGLVGVASAPGRAAMVEVNAETDFVARNDTFQAFVEAVAKIALQVGEDLDAIKAAPFPGSGRTVAERTDAAGRDDRREHEHPPRARAERRQRRGGDLRAQHAEAGPGQDRRAGGGRGHRRDGGAGDARPPGRHAHRGEHPRGDRHRQRRSCGAGAREGGADRAGASSGRPENIIEKMVEGRIRKFYEEVVLLEQVWVHDGESRVKAVLAKAGVKLAGFRPLQAGRRDRQAGGAGLRLRSGGDGRGVRLWGRDRNLGEIWWRLEWRWKFDLLLLRSPPRSPASISARPLDTDAVDAIWSAIDRYAVVVFRDQRLTDAQLRDFAARFGPLEIGRAAAAGRPAPAGDPADRRHLQPRRGQQRPPPGRPAPARQPRQPAVAHRCVLHAGARRPRHAACRRAAAALAVRQRRDRVRRHARRLRCAARQP